MKHFFLFSAALLLLVSCQKEFIDTTITLPGGGGGGTGSSNGTLLVKAVSISGTDTSTITLKWDANKRLIQHQVSGKANGISIDSKNDFIRDAAGKVTKVVTIPANTMGLIDSIVSVVTYQPGGSKIAYAIQTNYNALFPLRDSTVYTYNSAGKVSASELFMENFITGVWEKQIKYTYSYDAQGNLVTVVTSTPDLLGNYSTAATTTNTYDSHISALTLGDEVFLMAGVGPETVSPNHMSGKTVSGSGVSAVYTFSQTQYNSYNRPTSETLTATGTTPYVSKATYYYQ